MLKFLFKPQISVYEYISLLVLVSIMMVGSWILAFLLLIPVGLLQVVVARILQKREQLEKEEIMV
jgi:hypothetical protein